MNVIIALLIPPVFLGIVWVLANIGKLIDGEVMYFLALGAMWAVGSIACYLILDGNR